MNGCIQKDGYLTMSVSVCLPVMNKDIIAGFDFYGDIVWVELAHLSMMLLFEKEVTTCSNYWDVPVGQQILRAIIYSLEINSPQPNG